MMKGLKIEILSLISWSVKRKQNSKASAFDAFDNFVLVSKVFFAPSILTNFVCIAQLQHSLSTFVEVDPEDSRLISEAFKKSPMKIGRSSSRQDQTEEELRSESKPE